VFSSPGLIVAGETDVGLRRSHNDDNYGVDAQLEWFAVADGRGGHGSGAQASRVALTAMRDFIRAHANVVQCGSARAQRCPSRILGGAVARANDVLLTVNVNQGCAPGAGLSAAVAGAWFACEQWWIFNVGDCRVYRWYEGALARLTHDHTLQQVWLDNGTAGRLPGHGVRWTRALGRGPRVHGDVHACGSRPGEIYLICSNGLTAMLDDEAIAEVLRANLTVDCAAACRQLVAAANANGGVDNITVVAVVNNHGGRAGRHCDCDLQQPAEADASYEADVAPSWQG
jgi:protein phosphatase